MNCSGRKYSKMRGFQQNFEILNFCLDFFEKIEDKQLWMHSIRLLAKTLKILNYFIKDFSSEDY